MTDYEQDDNPKEKKENYKEFSYGKATIKCLFHLFLNDEKHYCIKVRFLRLRFWYLTFVCNVYQL